MIFFYFRGARSGRWRWVIGALTPLLTTVAETHHPSSWQLSWHMVLDQDSQRIKDSRYRCRLSGEQSIYAFYSWWSVLIGLFVVPLIFRRNCQKQNKPNKQVLLCMTFRIMWPRKAKKEQSLGFLVQCSCNSAFCAYYYMKVGAQTEGKMVNLGLLDPLSQKQRK